jgi:hypothetical protein
MEHELTTELASLLRRVGVGEETVFDVANAVNKDGTPRTLLTVVQRRVNPEPPVDPIKAASPRRAHTFHDAGGVVAFLNKYKTANTVILADAVNGRVTIVIDEAAGRGFETLQFVPQLHPLFTPWKAILGRWMPLRAAIDFLLDNRRVIEEPDGKQLARDLSQMKVASNVTRMQGIGTHSINGVMVETVISGHKNSAPMELPEEITVSIPMYIGCQPLDLTFDVSIEASEEHGVLFRMSSPDVAAKAFEAFDQFVRTIQDGLGGECVVALGQVAHTPWDVLVGEED